MGNLQSNDSTKFIDRIFSVGKDVAAIGGNSLWSFSKNTIPSPIVRLAMRLNRASALKLWGAKTRISVISIVIFACTSVNAADGHSLCLPSMASKLEALAIDSEDICTALADMELRCLKLRNQKNKESLALDFGGKKRAPSKTNLVLACAKANLLLLACSDRQLALQSPKSFETCRIG